MSDQVGYIIFVYFEHLILVLKKLVINNIHFRYSNIPDTSKCFLLTKQLYQLQASPPFWIIIRTLYMDLELLSRISERLFKILLLYHYILNFASVI